MILNIVDHLTMVFFTIGMLKKIFSSPQFEVSFSEYIIRFTCAPNKLPFVKAPLNVIDLLAILPYYVGFILEGLKDTLVIGRVGKVLRLIRVMRILRVFKVRFIKLIQFNLFFKIFFYNSIIIFGQKLKQ